MSAPAVPVIIGIDSSPLRLGIGVVRDEDGAALGCDVALLDGSPEATAEALSTLGGNMDRHGWEPTLAYLEEVFPPGRGMAYRAGIALGYVEAGLRGRWPWLTIQRISAPAWRSRVGLVGSGRRELKAAAIAHAEELGFTPAGSDDAAEASLIARAAWLDVEQGVCLRVNSEES